MNIPLSERLRPKNFEQVTGQEHLTGINGLLTKIIQKGHPLSILLWGPPGSGKTTIAKLYAKAFQSDPITLSAVTSGMSEIKEVIATISKRPLFHQKPLLFVDEIHRYNKAQQDLFLPYLENGTFILIGATTENPSFALNNALLSRLRVLDVKPLTEDALLKIIHQFEKSHSNISLTLDVKKTIIELSFGDGRHLLNTLENLETLFEGEVTTKQLSEGMLKKPALYDRDGQMHFESISALQKSIRGSNPDAALYWLSRMLIGGEYPEYLLRRLLRIANEDIGLADPTAQSLVISSWDAYKRLGSPEGDLSIATAVIYLALAPKSTASHQAFKAAFDAASKSTHLKPEANLLQEEYAEKDYFPHELGPMRFYHPNLCGFEREMDKRLKYFEKIKKERDCANSH
ncbi:MAG: replication-associated recombination protein A [Simkaniaceae bacterium]|nr:replication-associated recombination protein A [Simkaniaceae bacterium]